MYFQQFYLTCLSHASYMLGSEGLACVVDPQRDVALYIEEAHRQGLAIRYIIETHLHADFVSGHRELADRTGAQIYLGALAEASFPHVGVREGDEIRFGRVVLRFLETPGHTVESISITVTDLDRSERPFAVLTGDTLFIGDVGRPDLSKDKTPQQLAGMLYDSLHEKLLTLGDDVEVYPAHGAGSLCGKQMRPERQSTIGKERVLNYALRARSKEEFVRLVTAELPERPEYFAQDAELNRSGAPALTELPELAQLSAEEFLARANAGATILDTRPAAQFGAGHIPGAINIALSGQFATWAATLLGLQGEILLIAEDEEHLEESRIRLARVGIERVVGTLKGGMAQWAIEQRKIVEVPQIPAGELKDVQIVDVRRESEWAAGHIPGAILAPLHRLESMLAPLDPERPIVVHCQGGYRSAIACSLMQRAGFKNVINLIGGFDAWKALGYPVTAAHASQVG
ncbi:MAG: rhodanese-like domain-containing protein [Bryobacteraceae bacterium]|jgi:glyoxylase-like metal-dependent hydrolase (beta-lactamase superfamily II)/rhodanese-related sulfurtransferase